MNRLEIFDLSYCEATTNDKTSANGGQSAVDCLQLRRLRALPPFATEYLNYSDIYHFGVIETDSGVASAIGEINELKNPITGESGYQIISADGSSSSIVLSGPSSKTSFSIAIG